MPKYQPPPPIDPKLVVGDGTPWPELFQEGAKEWPPCECRECKPPVEQPLDGIELELFMPIEDEERKKIRLCSGVMDYFMAALIEVAKCSYAGNMQHYGSADNLKWVQSKSSKHADAILSHLADRGKLDADGVRHSAKLAWRALALLQIEMQEAGAPKPRSVE